MLNYDKDPIKFPIIYDNKFGIDNLEKLLKKEAKCTLFRESEIIKKDLFLKGPFDLKHLQSIHKHLFQDVYHTNNLTALTNRLMGVMQKVQQQQAVSPALESMQAGARKAQKDMQRGQSNQKANLKQNGGNYMG